MKPASIIVIDDDSRFPLHVWRYVSGCLGFGIGEVGADGTRARKGKSPERWIAAGDSIDVDDAMLRLWWVRADDDWCRQVAKIFMREGPRGRMLVLVDLHGRGRSEYSAQAVCKWLEQRRNDANVVWWLVSAYSGRRIVVEGKTHAVRPKSRDTLRRVTMELGIDVPQVVPSDTVRHVLVTGAGFEIQGDRGAFGMPPTREVLQKMEAPFWDNDGTKEREPPGRIAMKPAPLAEDLAGRGGAFPVACSGIWHPDLVLHDNLKELSNDQALDSFWDLLLEEELRSRLGGSGERLAALERDKRKAIAYRHERRLRQAFRRSLLRHDWGFMNQSLDAARLPLHAWLTTNYTHFADRAISLYGDVAQADLGDWHVVATAAEARLLAREVDDPGRGGKARYLFKLHGDIAHLQTMAIAGHDKDVFSPLSMPVEDLYEVYAAAERFLFQSLSRASHTLVVWHVVGHGLQDRRLCGLLGRVALNLHSRQARQVFAVVNPEPDKPATRLQAAFPGGPQPDIHTCKLSAGEYMARLHRLLGGPDQARVLEGVEHFRGWLSDTERHYEAAPGAGLF